MKTFCIFTEAKPNFDTKVSACRRGINDYIGYELKNLRMFYRFAVKGVNTDNVETLAKTILSNPAHDFVYFDSLPVLSKDTTLLCVEYLPGHFDSRRDSAEIAAQLAFGGEKPSIKVALVYAFEGLKQADIEKVKKKLINTSESLDVDINNWKEIEAPITKPSDIPVIEGFSSFSDDELLKLREKYSLAMALADLQCLRTYFNEEKRNPSLTEIKVFDVYWSDHCRHTTFNTIIDNVVINDKKVKDAYDLFLKINTKRDVTLMNIATAAMRFLKKNGKLPLLHDTGENNACTIKVAVDTNGKKEDWLLLFKNETHNHPTEIEPFAGASTCTGGAIRDPMSGRAFVYQALRLTGAGDPRADISTTLEGKLPQVTLTTTAAAGNSSYGNQIGLASSLSKELFHPGYVAKRMEGGAVVGAVPLEYTRFETPTPGDVVLLIGRPTGRDGLGGASSSSKTSNKTQDLQCGEEVPKGNPLEEHKIQRLFRDPKFLKLIKRCNDFGAGGVSVAIGEICDGLLINLDSIPCKYEGMDGTDLAISESQERMAVVVEAKDEALMKELCAKESVMATTVAVVTEEPRMIMKWRGKEIVNIKRSFLNQNGAEKHIDAEVKAYTSAKADEINGKNLEEKLLNLTSDLNFCSQKGIGQYFDGSVNASSVFAGAGGKEKLTESQVISSLFPVADCNTASVLSYGFDPFISNADPFGGAVNAVITSVAKLVASGADLDTVYLSFQEFFPSAKDDKKRWGNQLASMLGAFWAQMNLNIAAIGGKDSCSGTYGTLDVPQTLVSFAVAVANAKDLISSEFKKADNFVYLYNASSDFDTLKTEWKKIGDLIRSGKIVAARACEKGGAYGSIIKMSLGNMTGFKGKAEDKLFAPQEGSVVFESTCEMEGYELLGKTTAKKELDFGGVILSLNKLGDLWQAPLEKVFPVKPYSMADVAVPKIECVDKGLKHSSKTIAKPRAVIPVFHGTNCETDMANAVIAAGGVPKLVIMRNLNAVAIEESVNELYNAIKESQMLVLAGGFADVDIAGGAGNIITSIMRRPKISDAVSELLYNNDGLMLGVGNGFQALVKLGLIPYGKFTALNENSPILTTNLSSRGSCGFTQVRVAPTKSPWLSLCNVNDVYSLPFAHGEGRFMANEAELNKMKENGQIAFQYCDLNGNPTMDIAHNPNGSVWAIEGLISPDGRILGKMTHSERIRKHVAKNISGNKELPIFEGGMKYFK